MDILITRILDASLIFIWIAFWFLGGFLILVNTFKVRRDEATILGFGVGLILQVWVANGLGHVLEPLPAFWISAIFIFILGVFLTILFKNSNLARKQFTFPMNYWLAFFLISTIFFMIGRGLSIFDDYQNLPMTSYIAAGSIPPQFVLNPEVSFDYHYLMLLNAAQWMQVADLFPWTALDINRALFLGLAIVYAVLFGYRITKSKVAGWLTATFFAFASGFRWLLLFIPEPLLEKISEHITMIGSGFATADTLSAAMIKNWALEGSGIIDFPFAFGNGYHNVPVFNHDGTGLMGTVIAILVFLLFERCKNIYGKIVISGLLSAMALIDEIWFVFFIAATAVFFLLSHLVRRRSPSREKWVDAFLLIIVPVLFAAIQGGVLTGITNGLFAKIIKTGESYATQYYSINFPIRWPPAIISAHLGPLALTHWAQFIVAFCEVGPFLFIYPLFLIWGFKSLRAKRELFGILSIAITFSLLTVFVEYQGSAGISASKRLNLFAIDLLVLFAVPLLWYWLGKKRIQVKMLVSGIAFMTMLSGLIYFMISSIAIQRPVLSYFIKLMDASVENIYWDKLDENAMVFDFNPFRSATIFARPLKSSISWYEDLPEFQHLRMNPDPFLLNQAGYTHVYLSREEYRRMTARSKSLFNNSCVVREYENEDWQGDFRWLLDITACQK